MTWVKISDDMPDHMKIARLPNPAAKWLHICALCYCSRYLTDGVVLPEDLPGLIAKSGAKMSDVRALVAAGLWEERGSAYEIHDYLKYQPSADKVRADRAAAAERKQTSRSRRAGRPQGVTESVTMYVTEESLEDSQGMSHPMSPCDMPVTDGGRTPDVTEGVTDAVTLDVTEGVTRHPYPYPVPYPELCLPPIPQPLSPSEGRKGSALAPRGRSGPLPPAPSPMNGGRGEKAGPVSRAQRQMAAGAAADEAFIGELKSRMGGGHESGAGA